MWMDININETVEDVTNDDGEPIATRAELSVDTSMGEAEVEAVYARQLERGDLDKLEDRLYDAVYQLRVLRDTQYND